MEFSCRAEELLFVFNIITALRRKGCEVKGQEVLQRTKQNEGKS